MTKSWSHAGRQAAGQTWVTLTQHERCEEKEEREHQRGEVRALRCCHATLTATPPSQLLVSRIPPQRAGRSHFSHFFFFYSFFFNFAVAGNF